MSDQPTRADTIVLDLKTCSRCGEPHSLIAFKGMVRAMAPTDLTEVVWTHWAPCPVTGDPILMASRYLPK